LYYSKFFDVPRYRVIQRITPIDELSVLGKELGVRIFVKRDDLLDLALGGNKIRKLEFIFGDVLRKNADTVITTGAYHSNHARLTAAFARKTGRDVYLVLTPPGSKDSKDLRGNLLIDRLFDAKIIDAKDPDEAEKIMREIASELERRGRRPYIINRGGAMAPGVLGYAYAMFEILQQLYEMNIKPDYIVAATGTGATQAGLLLGKILAGLDSKIIGISVGRKADYLIEKIYELVLEGARYLNVDIRFSRDEIIVYDDYTFGGYGVINKDLVKVISDVAFKETILLDPVYTGKAMTGLIDLVNKNVIKKGSNILFIHTGGTPILFQYQEIISKYLEEIKRE
jgi:D-cysteine desulfhydrase family pyridoxal phosphate-dependent enzyme